MLLGSLGYAIYDQFLLNRLNGQTQLAIVLHKQRLDGWILLGLILLTTFQGISEGIGSFTLFLLAACVLLALYALLIRQPYWLFKENGFYLNGIFIDYAKIKAVNQSEYKGKPVFVIDLTNGKRLFARLTRQDDVEKIIQFFNLLN